MPITNYNSYTREAFRHEFNKLPEAPGAYMHNIRYSGAGRRSAMDIGDLPEESAKNCGKRRRPTTENMEETRQRWDNLADSIRRRPRGGTGSCSTPSIPSHLKNKKAREGKGEG